MLAVDQPEPICFVAPPGHPLAERKDLTLEDLVRQDFLLTERGMSYRDELDQWLASQAGLTLRPVWRRQRRAAGAAGGAGHGAFVPAGVHRPGLIGRRRLARLHTPDCQMEMHRQLFYHRDKWLTPQMKRFIDLVKEA